MLQEIYGKKKKKEGKKGEKNQESCRWTSLKFYLCTRGSSFIVEFDF